MQHYLTTHLEDWIYKFYRTLRIAHPEDININRISYPLGIYIKYKDINSQSFVQGRFRAITLDSRLSQFEQREVFFHELCHILLHVGKQYMMPKAFLELQEAQANRFTMYAALPFFMLCDINLEEENIVYKLSEQFGVTEQLVYRRLEQIYSRVLIKKQGELSHGKSSDLLKKI